MKVPEALGRFHRFDLQECCLDLQSISISVFSRHLRPCDVRPVSPIKKPLSVSDLNVSVFICATLLEAQFLHC